MGRIGWAIDEADGQGLHAMVVDEAPDRRRHLVVVQWPVDAAVGANPFIDLDPERPRHQRFGISDGQVVHIVAAFAGDIEDVGKALGAQEAGHRPALFDDRVGDQGGTVDDGVDLGHGDTRLLKQDRQARQHRPRRFGRCRQLLVDDEAAIGLRQ